MNFDFGKQIKNLLVVLVHGSTLMLMKKNIGSNFASSIDLNHWVLRLRWDTHSGITEICECYFCCSLQRKWDGLQKKKTINVSFAMLCMNLSAIVRTKILTLALFPWIILSKRNVDKDLYMNYIWFLHFMSSIFLSKLIIDIITSNHKN